VGAAGGEALILEQDVRESRIRDRIESGMLDAGHEGVVRLTWQRAHLCARFQRTDGSFCGFMVCEPLSSTMDEDDFVARCVRLMSYWFEVHP
jgi:hypothetical protein